MEREVTASKQERTLESRVDEDEDDAGAHHKREYPELGVLG